MGPSGALLTRLLTTQGRSDTFCSRTGSLSAWSGWAIILHNKVSPPLNNCANIENFPGSATPKFACFSNEIFLYKHIRYNSYESRMKTVKNSQSSVSSISVRLDLARKKSRSIAHCILWPYDLTMVMAVAQYSNEVCITSSIQHTLRTQHLRHIKALNLFRPWCDLHLHL